MSWDILLYRTIEGMKSIHTSSRILMEIRIILDLFLVVPAIMNCGSRNFSTFQEQKERANLVLRAFVQLE